MVGQRKRALGICIAVAGLLSAVSASSASAAFNPPDFIRSWDLGAATVVGGNHQGVQSVAVDPFGDVYALKTTAGANAQVLKFHHDGTPVAGQWTDQVPGAGYGAIASDPQGHIFIANGQFLREFTSTGVQLAEFQPQRFNSTILAIDGAGNVYADGKNASNAPALNEYSRSGDSYQLVHSTDFPGSPNTQFLPDNFLAVAVDGSGNVYASAETTTSRLLLKYGPGLSGSPIHLEDCAHGSLCFGGFGLAASQYANRAGEPFPAVFSASGYGNGDSGNFYRMGIYTADPPAKGGSAWIGSYDQQPVAGGYFTNTADVAASPCHGAVYEVVNIFGGPNNTFTANEMQEFSTRVAPTPCASLVVAAISSLPHVVVMNPARGGSGPCIPCASLLANGQPVDRSRAGGATSSAKKRGTTFKLTTSAAADITFMFKKLRKGKKPVALGGFLYAATAGKNSFPFTGVLRKGRLLKPGNYRVSVSGGQNTGHFKLRVTKNR